MSFKPAGRGVVEECAPESAGRAGPALQSVLRWIWRWLCIGVCFLSGIPAYAKASRESPAISIPGSGGLGEVAQYTADGQLLRRWTGLADIQSVHVASQGRLVVLQRGNHQLLEFDPSGTVLRSLSLRQADVFDGTILPSGHLLLAAGREGLVELDASGVVVWRLSPPDTVTEIVAAVRLANGTTVCAARPSGTWLFEVPAGSARMSPIVLPGIGPFRDLWQRPRLRALGSEALQAALWYEPWSNWFKLIWSGSVLQTHQEFPARGAVRAISGASDGMVWVAQAQFEVVRLLPSGNEAGWFAVADEIRDIAAGDGGSVFVATERTHDAARPAHRPPSPGHGSFSWLRLGFWVLGSISLIGVLRVATWRNTSDSNRHAPSPPTPPSGAADNTVPSHPQAWMACVAAAVVGLGVASVGWARLYQQGYRQGIPLLAGGAILVVIAGRWLRVVRGEVDQWWLKARAAAFPRRLLLPTWCIVGALLAGGLLLWRWRSSGRHYNDAVGLWVSLQLLCIGLLTFPASPFEFRGRRISRETVIHVGCLLLVASICLTADLGTVPQNVHGDVGLTVDYALRLLEGRADDLFTGGYAEIPYPGHLSTSLGLLIGGKTVAGSRLGAMLMGLAAVLGTYFLGREYKSARLGLFASILLLASIPFLHFSRSTPFGEVAAYSVWLLYLLLRAVRTAHPGAWLLCGALGGWGLLLFYSARVALLGAVVAGVLLSLRSFRVTVRLWYGPLLFLLAFVIVVVPMVPYWRSHSGAFFHRMDTSFSLYDPQTGFHSEVLSRAFGKPFLKTLGMFYTERDISGQGTLSPNAGAVGAILLSVGLAAALTDGWGPNVACLGWFLTMLLGCGAFAEATPWYTRLMPVTPVVSLFMARAIDLQLDLIPLKRRRWRWMVTALVSVALIGGVVAKNLTKYLNYERASPVSEFTAFGRVALALGPKYQFYCVTFQRPEFSCLTGSFVPYLATLDVGDLRDPARAVPFPTGRPVALMIPFQRFVPHPVDPKTLVDEIRARYPESELRYVYSGQSGSHSPLGVVVVLSP
jgi:hypothetical protein